MSSHIPDEIISRVRDSTDIVDVVSAYVSLKKSGRNHLGLCPFHNEKTPSFTVNREKKFFHCFGCGEHGNSFQFLMKVEGKTFPEVVRELAQKAGLELPGPAGAKSDGNESLRSRIYEACEMAARYYHKVLLTPPHGDSAMAYLSGREVGRTVIDKHRIGYAPGSGTALRTALNKKGYTDETLLAAGLLFRRESGGFLDKFRNRVIFPITDVSGKVIAFGGRTLEENPAVPKYINSEQTAVYVKGSAMFGSSHARAAIAKSQGHPMILVEGYLDLIMLDQAGYEGCVATCGTALTADQVQLMRRLSKTLCLCFDGDEAGRKAALKAAELLLPSDINARVVSLTDEADSGRKVDPDSFMRDYGPDAFKARIESALPLMDFIIDCYSPKKEGSIQDRGIAFEEIARRLALMSGDVQRGMYLAKISERLGIDERLAASRLAAIRRGTTGREGAGRGLEKDAQEGEGRKGPPKAEATLLLGSVTRSSLFDGIDTDRLAACMTDIEAASLLKGALAAAAAGSPMSLDALLDRVAGSGLGKTLTEMAAASGYLEGEEGRRAIRESADKVFRDWTGAQIAGVDAEIKKRSEAGDKDMSLLLARKTELARQLENLRGKRR